MDITTEPAGRYKTRGPYRQGLNLPQPTDRILRTREAATLIGLCVGTILERAKAGGDLPRFFRNGTGRNSPICFRLSDVNVWIEAR